MKAVHEIEVCHYQENGKVGSPCGAYRYAYRDYPAIMKSAERKGFQKE